MRRKLLKFIPALLLAFSTSSWAQFWSLLDPQRSLPPPGAPTLPTAAQKTSSTYVPMDSWVYPALDRLRAMGYLDTGFVGLRPWTWHSIGHMLDYTQTTYDLGANEEAQTVFYSVRKEIDRECPKTVGLGYDRHASIDSVYGQFRGITATPLRDSYHLGQTFAYDYGRPYQGGFNTYDGLSAKAEAGRFSVYFRGEYQHAPSAAGYSFALANTLSNIDQIPIATNPHQATIPLGPVSAANNLRVLEATASVHLIGHEISIGKNDYWFGPARGGSLLWTNNADNIYSFEVNRIEPLRVPLLSRITGPFRYQFLVGSLQGHTYPNSPWIHTEKISLQPTRNLEFGFARSVIWGGKGHEPITLHTFLRSFFSLTNVTSQTKYSSRDPGDRLGSFDFNYRVPFVRNWLTLYADAAAHDDVNPISAPRRASYRTGVYLSHFPGADALDLRVEAANTDPPTSRSNRGEFLYWEAVQRQGFTNKGFLIGDAIGRENKGGQVWLTYHLSPRESIQGSFRTNKAAKDFIPGGATQNDAVVSITKRLTAEFEFQLCVQHERYKIPLLVAGQQSDTAVRVGFTWYPSNLDTAKH
jgi:hypothetical protein